MRDDILARAQQLRAEQSVFALATVVVARQPTSGSPGAHALILPDGQVEGWIGGHCARPAVIRQSIEALEAGTPRLVVISPDVHEPTSLSEGVVRVPMLCAGQGELQVFIEPFLPKVALVFVGESTVARTLSRLAALLDFEVWACDPLADMERFPDADRLVPTLDALAQARRLMDIGTDDHQPGRARRDRLDALADHRWPRAVAADPALDAPIGKDDRVRPRRPRRGLPRDHHRRQREDGMLRAQLPGLRQNIVTHLLASLRQGQANGHNVVLQNSGDRSRP